MKIQNEPRIKLPTGIRGKQVCWFRISQIKTLYIRIIVVVYKDMYTNYYKYKIYQEVSFQRVLQVNKYAKFEFRTYKYLI